MTDQAVAADQEPEVESEEGAEAPKPSGKMPGRKLILFIALPVLLIIGGAAGAFFSGLLDPLLGLDAEGAAEEDLAPEPTGPAVFYEIPEMLVNLSAAGRKTGYLKITVVLELVSQEDLAAIEGVMPRVVDSFQVYLRGLRVEDLQGSAGLQRLREELLLRVATAAQPVEVKDVLFRDMLIQ